MCHWTANVRCKICFVEWQQLSLTVYMHVTCLSLWLVWKNKLDVRQEGAAVIQYDLCQWLEIGDCERRLCRQSLLETLTTTRASRPLGLYPSTATLFEILAYAFQVANHLTGQVEVENSKDILRIAKHVCIDGISWVSLAIFPHIPGINKPLLTNTGLISNRRPAASWPISFDDSGLCQFAAGQRSSTKGTLALTVLFICIRIIRCWYDLYIFESIGSYLGIWWNMQIDADRLYKLISLTHKSWYRIYLQSSGKWLAGKNWLANQPSLGARASGSADISLTFCE